MCAVITLEVQNTSNCASWEQIIHVLLRRDVNKSFVRNLRCYLSGRNIIFKAKSKKKILEVYRGVPQGSFFGFSIMESSI